MGDCIPAPTWGKFLKNHVHIWEVAFQIGRVQAGDVVLIHAAASGVGTAAIQIAVQAGAIVIATAGEYDVNHSGQVAYSKWTGSDDKVAFVKELGAKLAINYKNDSTWEKTIKTEFPGGVDVILDCVGASYWKQNCEVNCFALHSWTGFKIIVIQVATTDARWVLFGLLGGPNVDGPLFLELLRKRINIIATTLRNRDTKYKAQLTKRFYHCFN